MLYKIVRKSQEIIKLAITRHFYAFCIDFNEIKVREIMMPYTKVMRAGTRNNNQFSLMKGLKQNNLMEK